MIYNSTELLFLRGDMAQPAKKTTKIVRPLRGGQITIPAEFRQELGIGPDTVLEIALVEGELRMKPLPIGRTVAGSPWIKDLYDAFAPVREEAKRQTPEVVDQAIDTAV